MPPREPSSSVRLALYSRIIDVRIIDVRVAEHERIEVDPATRDDDERQRCANHSGTTPDTGTQIVSPEPPTSSS